MTARSNARLFIVGGAPGAAGKTTVLPRLVDLADGLVVTDMDELLDDGALLGVPIADPAAAPIWPAYDRIWRRIVAMVRRAGHPVLLLAPTPSQDAVGIGGPWQAPVHWALLDCAEQVRVSRLQARGWSQAWIDDAVRDAAQARDVIPTVIATGGVDSDEVAKRILAWVAGADDRATDGL